MKGEIVIRGRKVRRFSVQVNIYATKQSFAADCPALRLASHGKTERAARRALSSVIEVFLEECLEMGTIDRVLADRGWRKRPDRPTTIQTTEAHWIPPKVLSRQISIPAAA